MKTKETHTPGPWTATLNEIAGVIMIGCEDDYNFVSVYLDKDEDAKRKSERWANARLIAASPDLLAAMPTVNHPGGRLLKVIAIYADGSTQTIDGEVIERAVAKATGGAS